MPNSEEEPKVTIYESNANTVLIPNYPETYETNEMTNIVDNLDTNTIIAPKVIKRATFGGDSINNINNVIDISSELDPISMVISNGKCNNYPSSIDILDDYAPSQLVDKQVDMMISNIISHARRQTFEFSFDLGNENDELDLMRRYDSVCFSNDINENTNRSVLNFNGMITDCESSEVAWKNHTTMATVGQLAHIEDITPVKHLIGILAKRGHGRTICANWLSDNYEYETFTIYTPLKDAIVPLFGFSYAQMHDECLKETLDNTWGVTPNQTLQWFIKVMRDNLSTLTTDTSDERFWVKLLKQRIEKSKANRIVVSDINCVEGVELIRALGGIIIKIERIELPVHLIQVNLNDSRVVDHVYNASHVQLELNEDNKDINAQIDEIIPDYTIINDSTKGDLFAKLEDILRITEYI
jgi:hypothetical protein